MSRPADAPGEQPRGSTPDGGFSLVEVVVSMGILVLLITFVLPALLVGIRADDVAQRTTQARNIAQSHMERLRNLPFHVAFDVSDPANPYVDLLDNHYRDDAPAPGVTCGASGAWTLPTTGWTGYVAAGGSRCAWEPDAGAFYRHVHVGSGAEAGYVIVTATQFLSDRTPPTVVAAPSDWDTQATGTDAPPVSQVGVTVTVFSAGAGDREPVSTSSQLTTQRLVDPQVDASVQVAAVQLGTNVSVEQAEAAEPIDVPLTLSAGLVDLSGTVTASSTTDAVLSSTLTGLGTGQQAQGAAAAGAAPDDQVVLPATVLPGALDLSGCDLVCWGSTSVNDFGVRASNGLPGVGTPGDPARVAVTDLDSGGVSLATGPAAAYRERLKLAGPLVRLAEGAAEVGSGISGSCVAGTGGDSVRVAAGGWLSTTGELPTSDALGVEACGAASASTLAVLPTNFAPQGVLQVSLERASASCTVSGAAHVADTAVDYRAVVSHWNGSGPYEPIATIDSGATTQTLTPEALAEIQLPGQLKLSDYIASWSSITADDVMEQESAGEAVVEVPALVSIVTQPVRPGTEPLTMSDTVDDTTDDAVDPTSSVSVSVGAVSCSALDAR